MLYSSIKQQIHLYKYTRNGKYKRGRPPPGGGEGGASSNISEGGGGVHRGRELGCPLGELPLHQGKGPLRKVGRAPTGTAALPAKQMESVPASV